MKNDKKENGFASEKSAQLSNDSGEMISLKLKELYESVCEEGVSDRFLDLLEKLDEAEKKSGSEGTSL